MIEIPQKHIGSINVVGNCMCFGLVVDRPPRGYKRFPVYINVAGASTSVEALWAKLNNGRDVTVVPAGKGYPVYLDPPKGGVYTRVMKKIPQLGIDHMILMHDSLATPVYPGADNKNETTTVYMLWTDEQQRLAKFGEHLTKAVKIAVFPEWFQYLYDEGRSLRLVRDLEGYEIQALALLMDAKRWTELITNGLRLGKLCFPVAAE